MNLLVLLLSVGIYGVGWYDMSRQTKPSLNGLLMSGDGVKTEKKKGHKMAIHSPFPITSWYGHAVLRLGCKLKGAIQRCTSILQS